MIVALPGLFSYLFFIKSFTKIKEDKVILFSRLHVFSSSTSIISCVSQDIFSRNPCCNSNRIFCSVKCLEMVEATTCSSTLQRTQVRDVGR